MNQILLYLGIKSDQFSAGLSKATAEAKEFGHQWHGLKKLFEAGGVLTAALFFFKEIIDHAQETRKELQKLGQPIPEATRAVAAFGDAMKDVKDVALWVPEHIVAGWNMIGESIGYAINRLRGYSEAQQNQIGATQAAADAAEKRLAKAREENSPEKIAAAEEHLAQVRREQAVARAEGQEKLNLLMEQGVALAEQANQTGENSIKGARLREQIEQNTTEIIKTQEEIRKKAAETAKSDAEKAQKKMDDEWNMWWDNHDKEEKAKKDAAEQAKKEAKELAELEEKRRKIMEGQAEAAKRTQKAYEALMFGITNGGASSQDIQASSDAALAEKVRRNNGALQGLRSNPGSAFDYGNGLNILRLENENKRLQAELNTRNSIRNSVTTLGVEGARRSFTGDPLVFDRLVEQFTKAQSDTGRLTSTVQKLVDAIGPGSQGNLPATVLSLTEQVSRGFQQLSAGLQDIRRN